MAGMLLSALDQSIVGTALPRIVSELGGLDQLSWVVTAYLLTSTATTPLWGKISDLYGRRLIFQVAIVIFLIGSALSGLSQNMGQLIAFRAVQGIGGGGLFAIALSIIGDVIPPRERGRYQGYFGAVFGVSSVAGPLLGGWLTDGPGWRWIFYINLPVGLAALFVTSAVLKMPVVRRQHKIDYLGAAAIVGAVTCLLLYLDWRGVGYGWTEAGALVLLGGAILLAAAFLLVEPRAAEPIIPLRLFRNPVFSVGNAFAFLAGVVMFGTIIFLPLYLQAVMGFSPTRSGPGHAADDRRPLLVLDHLRPAHHQDRPLQDLPGDRRRDHDRRPARRCRASASTRRTGRSRSTTYLFGAGLGLTMQTIVTAVQNSVERRDMGAATSSTTFFRQMGGSIGAAVFGAVLSSRLAYHLSEQLAEAGIQPGAGGPAVEANNVQGIQSSPSRSRHRAGRLHQRPRRRVPVRGAVRGRSPSWSPCC